MIRILQTPFSRLRGYLRRDYSFGVTTKKNFLAFRVSSELKNELLEMSKSEARSISQICELILADSVDVYKKEGPKFVQRLVAKQKGRAK